MSRGSQRIMKISCFNLCHSRNLLSPIKDLGDESGFKPYPQLRHLGMTERDFQMKVIMPQMGESVAEGTILKWLVQEGEKVSKDQSLVEISTDKIDTEIPSPVSGILKKILHTVDETVPVGSVIAEISEEAGEITEEKAVEVKTPVMEPPLTALVSEKILQVESEQRYSPLVRKLASEYGINLQGVKGTGIGGRT